jgi:hypothetical protein
VTAERPAGWVDNYVDSASAYGDDRWHFDFGCLSFQVLSLTGEDIGPEQLPGNLQGDVRFTLGSGCGAFDYGAGQADGGPAGVAPTAVAQAKPAAAKPKQKVRFDGSGSFDDADAPTALQHAWDFDGDGSTDATGSSVTHKYETAGTYTATLTVTDSGGLTGTDTITIVVR